MEGSNWEMVCSDKHVKVIATWLPDLKLALKLKGSKGIRKLTGQNRDADGHSLHLGLWPKVNNVQGAIWLRLGKGRGCRRVWEGRWVKRRVATSTSIWKSRFFLSLQRSGKANVSMRCVHAWLCCTQPHHLALLAQPPSMGSSDTVELLPRAEESITVLRIIHMHACTPTPPARPALFHTRDTQKKRWTFCVRAVKLKYYLNTLF